MTSEAFNIIAKVDISGKLVNSNWTLDYDPTADGVPSGASCVLLQFMNTDTSNLEHWGVRDPTIETATYGHLRRGCHAFGIAPIVADLTDIFNAGDINCFVLGYGGSGITMLTNRITVTHADKDAWKLDVDWSAHLPEGTIAVIVEHYSGSLDHSAIRHPDSSSDWRGYPERHQTQICGVSATRTIDQWQGTGSATHITGYITAGMTLVPEEILSPAGGAFRTVTPANVPTGALNLVISLKVNTDQMSGWRKESGADEVEDGCTGLMSGVVELTATPTCDLYANTSSAMVIGYCEEGGAPPTPGPSGPNIGTFEDVAGGSINSIDGVPWSSISTIDGVG